MAAKAGMSHTTVGRIWRTFGLKPHVTESFKISPDPQLIEKVRDVVGLYMNPPTNAAVFSFDEKSQIQALERAQPILPMDIGQPERRTHNYIRNGTLDLFAALNVATGEVLARCKPRHRAADFVAFLREIDASVAAALEVHVVLDNLSAHRAPLVHRWLLRHPRFHLHFTPTYASWLNLVERFFAMLTEKAFDVARIRACSNSATPSSRMWRRTTRRANPLSGPRPPTRFSTRCAALVSARSRCMGNDQTFVRNHRSGRLATSSTLPES